MGMRIQFLEKERKSLITGEGKKVTAGQKAFLLGHDKSWVRKSDKEGHILSTYYTLSQIVEWPRE